MSTFAVAYPGLPGRLPGGVAILGAAMERNLDERVASRAPGLFRRLVKLVLALPPNSPVRRRVLRWVGARGWSALSRGDDEIALLLVDRDVEINHVGGLTMTGLAERYHGHEGLLEFLGLWRAEWAGKQITHTPEVLIDLGDRLVWRVKVTARGATSGADVSHTSGFVHWLADGLVVRQDVYQEWSECIEALGLDEAAPAVSS